MDTKSQFYRSIGDGRDSYIYHNNGGMYPPCLPMQEYPVSSFRGHRRVASMAAKSPERTMRYHSNGTGRDNYIVTDSGGFEGRKRKFGPGATFYASLRETDLSMRRTFDGEDYLEMQKTWLPVRQKEILSRRSKLQHSLITRLSKPKSPSSRHNR